jgi:hypothetical protein
MSPAEYAARARSLLVRHLSELRQGVEMTGAGFDELTALERETEEFLGLQPPQQYATGGVLDSKGAQVGWAYGAPPVPKREQWTCPNGCAAGVEGRFEPGAQPPIDGAHSITRLRCLACDQRWQP